MFHSLLFLDKFGGRHVPPYLLNFTAHVFVDNLVGEQVQLVGKCLKKKPATTFKAQVITHQGNLKQDMRLRLSTVLANRKSLENSFKKT